MFDPKAYAREYYKSNRELLIFKATNRNKIKWKEHRKACREWARRNRVKVRESQRRWIENNKEQFLLKKLARNKIRVAVRKGRLVRGQICEKCGKHCKTQAHHHNGYDKSHALDVKWLCSDCHYLAH